jgi:hypothetical protein
MKNSIATLLVAGLGLSFGIIAAPAQDKELDRKADAFNAAAKQKMKAAYQCISTETGTPVDRIENLHKKNPEVGPAGLLLAFALAGETKQTASHFVESRVAGKSWGAIAHDNKVPVEKLNQHLDHVTSCLSSAPAKTENPKDSKPKK